MRRLTNEAPYGKPIQIPSTWRYIMLVTLNATDFVAEINDSSNFCFRKLKRGKVTMIECIVSSSGTIVKRPIT